MTTSPDDPTCESDIGGIDGIDPVMDTIETVYSLVDIAPTISALIDVSLPGADGEAIPELIDRVSGCDHVILIIVDSLGYLTYLRLRSAAQVMRGTLIRCRAVADHTTPAIASILTGCYPETHGILTTADVCTSEIKSILERAEECGVRSAVAIESEGAIAMKTKIELSAGVPDGPDILEYDQRIRDSSIELLKHEPVLLVAHFRAIDRYAHEDRSFEELVYAAKTIDEHIKEIRRNARGDTSVFVCGDHPIHGRYSDRDRDVALILLSDSE